MFTVSGLVVFFFSATLRENNDVGILIEIKIKHNNFSDFAMI